MTAYCPAHRGVSCNAYADALAKTATGRRLGADEAEAMWDAVGREREGIRVAYEGRTEEGGTWVVPTDADRGS